MKKTYWRNGVMYEVDMTPEEIAAMEQPPMEQTPEPTLEDRLAELEAVITGMANAYKEGVEEA